MKKVILFVLVISLMGCEKYELPSNPQLNVNGPWVISNITPTFFTTISDSIKIVSNDFYALSPFIIVSYDRNNNMIIKNDTTNIRPCFFFKKGYSWEFDYNTLIIKNQYGNTIRKYFVVPKDQYYNPNDFYLKDNITGETIPGNWHMKQNGNGALPANELTITVPEIWFDIMGSNRTYVRAVNQKLNVEFTR